MLSPTFSPTLTSITVQDSLNANTHFMTSQHPLIQTEVYFFHSLTFTSFTIIHSSILISLSQTIILFTITHVVRSQTFISFTFTYLIHTSSQTLTSFTIIYCQASLHSQAITHFFSLSSSINHPLFSLSFAIKDSSVGRSAFE